MGIAQSVQKAVTTAQKLLKQIKQVVDTLRQIIQTVQQILQLVQQVKQLLQRIGGKATGEQQAQTQAQAVGYRSDTSGYYDTSRAGHSGTTETTPNAQPAVVPVAPIPQIRRPSDISLAVLRAIMPQLAEAKAKLYLPLLNAAMAEAGITTPQRQSAFLAQLAHESGQFRYMQEIASGSAYEGRRDLGNVNPGDGQLYKGRGPIQLTGRDNYRAAGEALGLDLEANPRQAAEPSVGFRTAAWYWNTRDLNTYADEGNFREITRRINGGYNGLADRERYYAAARQALGL
jgi:predicted chitinase